MLTLQDWRPKVDVRNLQRHQRPIDAIRELQQSVLQAGQLTPSRLGLTGYVGKIVTAGPAAEADYADARYWVQRQYVPQTAFRDPIAPDEDTMEDELVSGGATGEPSVVTATNLAELAEDSHTLPADEYVFYWVEWDHGDPSQFHYVFSRVAGGVGDEVLVYVETAAAASNCYDGKIWTGRAENANPAAGIDFITWGMDTAASTDAFVIDLQPYGDHVLALPQNLHGKVIGTTNETPARRVVVVNAGVAKSGTTGLANGSGTTDDPDDWQVGNGMNGVNPDNPGFILSLVTDVQWDSVAKKIYVRRRNATADGLGRFVFVGPETDEGYTLIDLSAAF